MFENIKTATTVLAFVVVSVFLAGNANAQNTVTCQYSFINVPGAGGTVATKLNNNMTVVGTYLNNNFFETFGFVDRAGTITTFRVPNSQSTQILGINNRGIQVGFYIDSNFITHGFVRNTSGSFTTIDAPGSSNFTEATSISDRSEIVGFFRDSSGQVHGFLLNNGQFTQLDLPNANGTLPQGNNNSGTVVGNYVDSNGQSHGFVLENGQFTTLDFPGAAGGTNLMATNNTGEIVGFVRNPSTDAITPFIFRSGIFSTITPLPNSSSQVVYGVNDKGMISGAVQFNNNTQPGYTATCQ